MGYDYEINNTHSLTADNIASIDLGKGIVGGADMVIPMSGNEIYNPVQIDYEEVEIGYWFKRTVLQMTLTVSRRPEIVSENSGLVSTGFSEYLAVEFNEGYSLENTELIVDGVDISDNMTAVSDDGKILKWQLSSFNLAELIARDINSGREQCVKLSANEVAQPPVLNDGDEAAYAIIAHGSVPVWDYHLTNYDEDGNVRVSPDKTTFSLNPEENQHKFFSPVAELVETDENSYGVKADVKIMFNYASDEDMAYFDAISENLALVEYDENLNTLNDDLAFTKTTTEHYGHQIGVLTIPVPQVNFYANKRYLVRVSADGYKTQLVPIHLVNEKAPTMILAEQGPLESGKNIHFTVEDMTYGATMPIETVTLTAPNGETTQLEKIRDYYLIGDLFVLYNDVNAENGRNNIPYNGQYTLYVQSNGFKDMQKSFIVENGEDVTTSDQDLQIDAYSSASVNPGGGGNGGAGGGSAVMSATLVFNVDLLTNAIIIDALGIENEYAKGIVDRFVSDMIADYIYTEEGTPFYTYNHFYDAYQEAKIAGNYLSFKDYTTAGDAVTTQNRPYAVKEVLEDNLLGQTQYSGDYLGKTAPQFKIKDDATAVVEGNDAILLNDDDYYLSLVEEITVNGEAVALDDYAVGDKELVIAKDYLIFGENEVQIQAIGYKVNNFTFEYQKVLEDISLSSEGEHIVNQDVVIKVENTEGDFLNNFESVTVNGKQLLTESAGGNSQNDWYELSADSVTIKGGNFETAGSYTIAIQSEFYELQTITIEVVEDDELARLVSFSNVIVTSHQGYFTQEALEGIVATTFYNFKQIAQGRESYENLVHLRKK